MKFLLLLMLAVVMAPAHAIKKCKDADGNWHYGDIAVEECESSKITTLNKRGFITEEEAAPKTEEELAAEKRLLELETETQNAKEELELENRRILSIYETVEDIERQRDNQLYSVDSNIAVHNTYIKGQENRIDRYNRKKKKVGTDVLKKQFDVSILESQEKIKTANSEIAELQIKRAEIIEKFDSEKEKYLALKAASK